MNESFPFSLYNWANVDSTNALEEPSKAISHIQNTDPGPPIATAVATPARFPVPTRLAKDTAKAWKEEICFSPFSPFHAESPYNRIISPIMRNCTNLLFIVNHTAHPNNMIIRMYDHNISLTPLIQLFNSSMIYNLLFGYKDTYLRSKFIEILFFYHFLVTFSKRLSSYS